MWHDVKDAERMDILSGTNTSLTMSGNVQHPLPPSPTVVHHIHPSKISNRKWEIYNAPEFLQILIPMSTNRNARGL